MQTLDKKGLVRPDGVFPVAVREEVKLYAFPPVGKPPKRTEWLGSMATGRLLERSLNLGVSI